MDHRIKVLHIGNFDKVACSASRSVQDGLILHECSRQILRAIITVVMDISADGNRRWRATGVDKGPQKLPGGAILLIDQNLV